MTLEPQNIRVFLVDDHPTMLWGLERLIEGAGPRMAVAGTAASFDEARARVPEVEPDVVVLDMDLGGRSSLELMPFILERCVAQILVLTAGRDQATLDRAMVSGARGVVSKAAPAQQVLDAIEAVHRGEVWLEGKDLGRVFSQLVQGHGCAAPQPAQQTLPVPHERLTTRERRIVACVVEQSGGSNAALADCLCIAEHTLRNHLSTIYQKLGVHNRLELYVYALKHQLDQA
ncbi:MAG: response regulator transcription factor [Proteobacteria bacterium]|nr:response regulator transcription factor [Pseudomonadota bacterium]